MTGKRILALLSAAFLILGIFSSCQAPGESTGAGDGKTLAVSVTFNAMEEFAKAVGGDRVAISVIIPDGTEPHDFEPKAEDLAGLSKANVFVYNGMGMETWVDSALSAIQNPNLITVDASDGITPIPADGSASGSASASGNDPHTWLSLTCAVTEIENIRDAFCKADPAEADYFQANASSFVSQLQSLLKEYTVKFQTAPRKTIVTGHAAFAYLCRDFGLTQNSVENVFASGEPSAKQLAGLVDYCRENHVTTVFSERLASPEISETLAAETGAKLETIYTMESDEDHLSYLDRMQKNLEEFYDSLT